MGAKELSGPKTSWLDMAEESRLDTQFQGFEAGTQMAGRAGAPGVGWCNPVTGMGTTRDKTAAGVYQGYTPVDLITLSNLYHGDDLSARIIDIPGDEMLRRPYRVTVKDEDDATEFLRKEFKRLYARRSLLEGTRWGRLYGGAWGVLGADDGRPASEPLIAEKAKEVGYLRVVDRRFMWPVSYYETGPKMGDPDRYVISQTYAGVAQGSYVIHESRMIRFHGVPTGLREKNLNAGYDYSVLDRCWPQLRMFSTLWKGVELLITEGPQAVYKVKGLADKLMAGQRDALRTRFAMMDYLRSVLRAVIIDADQEEFERQPLQLAGVHEILNQAAFRISATAEVPTMVLFGQDPSGLNASGTASLRWWQDKMASKQMNDLGPQIEEIAGCILATQGRADLVDKLEVDFEPLYTPTELEEAQALNANASARKTLVDAQIFTPEEMAISAVKDGKWVNGWEGIRNEERKKMLDDVIDNLINGTEPGAPPVVNGRMGNSEPDPVELVKAQAEAKAQGAAGAAPPA
jgi:phage-related protein (TIGR01555 family)